MPAHVEVLIVSRLGGKKFLSEKQEGGPSVDARGEHAHAVRIRGFAMRGARYGPGAKKARPLSRLYARRRVAKDEVLHDLI